MPNEYRTEAKATVRVTNRHLANDEDHAERRAERDIERAIHNALRQELGSELAALQIDVEGHARRVDE